MGCIICNILQYLAYTTEEELEAKEELCNDIVVNHPEMVKRIMEICNVRTMGT